jgi:hypothetical protein
MTLAKKLITDFREHKGIPPSCTEQMVLTKHLYELEEVRAALLWSIKQGRLFDMVFWLDELEDSCYGSEAGRLLWVAWMLWIGVGRLSWLEQWAVLSNDRSGRLQLCIWLRQIQEKDSSLWIAICAKALGETVLVKSSAAAKDTRLDAVCSKMRSDLKGYRAFGEIVGQILSSGVVVPTTSWKPFQPADLNEDIKEKRAVWLETTVPREGRTCAIPYDCLFGMTARGKGSNTAEQLRCLNLETLKRSPYWKRLVPVDSDDGEFWDTYFPWASSDIPDEWPLFEQEKSHGAGATGSSTSPLSRWWRNWVSFEKTIIKGSADERVKSYISEQTIGEHASVLDRFLALL